MFTRESPGLCSGSRPTPLMGVTVQSDTDRDGEEIKSVGGWFYYYEIGDDCVGNKYG